MDLLCLKTGKEASVAGARSKGASGWDEGDSNGTRAWGLWGPLQGLRPYTERDGSCFLVSSAQAPGCLIYILKAPLWRCCVDNRLQGASIEVETPQEALQLSGESSGAGTMVGALKVGRTGRIWNLF